jgi:peptidoglycan/LPS O-acetylase OafA/YrhL
MKNGGEMLKRKVSRNRNSMKKQLYYPQLDSIRGLSFLGIFLYHSIHPEFGSGLISSFVQYLYHQLPLAIDVFFLLSSFLLTRIGLVEYEKRNNFSFINYFTRRVLRIWPLYYLLMFLSFIVFPIMAVKAGASMSLPDPLFYVFFCLQFLPCRSCILFKNFVDSFS